METIKFTRKKQFLTFLNETVSTKREEIRHLESIVDSKFTETLGYHYGFEYTEQYSYEVIFAGRDGRKAIVDNMQRSTLWDMTYHANGLISKMSEQIAYLKFAIEHGKKFATYKECVNAWFEFRDNGTIPTKIDTENVEKVESFNDEACKNQVDFLNAVQKDLQNYQNRQTRKVQLNEETTKIDTEKVENVETTEEKQTCGKCAHWEGLPVTGKSETDGHHMGHCGKCQVVVMSNTENRCGKYSPRSRVPTGDISP